MPFADYLTLSSLMGQPASPPPKRPRVSVGWEDREALATAKPVNVKVGVEREDRRRPCSSANATRRCVSQRPVGSRKRRWQSTTGHRSLKRVGHALACL